MIDPQKNLTMKFAMVFALLAFTSAVLGQKAQLPTCYPLDQPNLMFNCGNRLGNIKHPFDATRYIKCGAGGKAYACSCPVNAKFDSKDQICQPKKIREKRQIEFSLPETSVDQDFHLLPPILKAQWPSTKQWPVSYGFVTVEHGNKIYFWGGRQHQKENDWQAWLALPLDSIYIYDFAANLWTSKNVSGDVPSYSTFPAYVLLNGIVYIFGGVNDHRPLGNTTNLIHSLSLADGVFKSLPVSGDQPSPRMLLHGWSYDGQLYFFSGSVEDKSSNNNLLFQFNPQTNTWSIPPTKGQQPKPRGSYASASLDHRVFIHGGWDAEKTMFELNMKTMTWARISDSGPARWGHSLTPISDKHLILIGGKTQTGVKTNPVWTYNTEDFSWDELPVPFPSNFQGSGKGELANHRAVQMKTKGGSSVVCLGGVFWANQAHPLGMLIFSIDTLPLTPFRFRG